jgi:hypothetical protein
MNEPQQIKRFSRVVDIIDDRLPYEQTIQHAQAQSVAFSKLGGNPLNYYLAPIGPSCFGIAIYDGEPGENTFDDPSNGRSNEEMKTLFPLLVAHGWFRVLNQKGQQSQRCTICQQEPAYCLSEYYWDGEAMVGTILHATTIDEGRKELHQTLLTRAIGRQRSGNYTPTAQHAECSTCVINAIGSLTSASAMKKALLMVSLGSPSIVVGYRVAGPEDPGIPWVSICSEQSREALAASLQKQQLDLLLVHSDVSERDEDEEGT